MKMIFPQIFRDDVYLFHEGSHFYSYRFLGAHLTNENGFSGVRFTLWAPGARYVQVVGDFNCWQGDNHFMERLEQSGIWSLFIPGLKPGDLYKYQICTSSGQVFLKADPYAFFSECRPATASKVYSVDNYEWHDQEWQEAQKLHSPYNSPLNIYEVHLGSWKHKEGRFLSYREMAQELVDYVADMGYTHVELMPVMEHPFDGSWGYQATGYYAVTSRYGTPWDFKYFVDRCHQKGIGVILDWVPGHFCRDAHGLENFDGTSLFEYCDERRKENQDWGTLYFDLGKPEVRSFLISNAVFWFDVYHADGLRIDAVASMLYLDYGKKPGEWIPNKNGGKENLEAVAFMQKLNEVIFAYFPQALMIAEESTEWPMVTGPTYSGGLGYNFKWNMGWMNDMLRYVQTNFTYRKHVHNLVTFSLMYAFAENFILPLSHDEVVHGKNSLLGKMPGSYWEKFAGLRVFYGFMMAHPGKKLLFMGGEFGQFNEWCFYRELDWILLEFEMHKKLQFYGKFLNCCYLRERSLWEYDHKEDGFCWINPDECTHSIVSFYRKAKDQRDLTVIVCNFSLRDWDKYRIGVPVSGCYEEMMNSNWEEFGGTGRKKNLVVQSQNIPWQKQHFSIEIRISPLTVVYLKLRSYEHVL